MSKRLDLLSVCKLVYRKHCLNDDSIGWGELDDIIYTVLCNEMGDDGFIEWLKEVNGDQE